MRGRCPEIKWEGARLPLKKALFLCWLLWEWIAEEDREKDEWPYWARNGGAVRRMPHDCPCCEYVTQRVGELTPEQCAYLCPLKELWPQGCTCDDSPFTLWRGSLQPEQRRGYAQAIAETAKRKYLNLKKERGNK